MVLERYIKASGTKEEIQSPLSLEPQHWVLHQVPDMSTGMTASNPVSCCLSQGHSHPMQPKMVQFSFSLLFEVSRFKALGFWGFLMLFFLF